MNTRVCSSPALEARPYAHACGDPPTIVLGRLVRADAWRLGGREARLLVRLGLSGARRLAWIRGRVIARVALELAGVGGGELLAEPDGAPRSTVAGVEVSLSHHAPWVAVAIGRRRRVAVDLCPRAAAARLERQLTRAAIDRRDCDAAEAWAALECALKLRRLPVQDLLRGGLEVVGRGDALEVRGLGAPIAVTIADRHGLVVARSEATW